MVSQEFMRANMDFYGLANANPFTCPPPAPLEGVEGGKVRCIVAKFA